MENGTYHWTPNGGATSSNPANAPSVNRLHPESIQTSKDQTQLLSALLIFRPEKA